MAINWGAVLKTAGVGAIVLVLLQGCGYAFNAAMGIPPGTVPTDPSALPPGYQLYTLALGCIGYLLYLGYGALYAFFAGRAGTPIQAGTMAVGGAVTGIIIALISTVLAVVNILILLPAMQAAFEAQGLTDLPAEGMGIVLAGAGVGVVVGLCIAFVVGGGLAAAGGAIYAAIMGSRREQTATM